MLIICNKLIMNEPKDYKSYLTNLTNCDVCGSSIFVDQFGNNSLEPCANCGWKQNKCNLEQAHIVMYPNFLSLENAKKLHSQGKKLIPTFDEFIECYKCYGEVGFYYNNKKFALSRPKQKIEFLDISTGNYKNFDSIEHFKQNAMINNVLLKNMWHLVESLFWLG